MTKVQFPITKPLDISLKYVVILPRYKGKWVFARHKKRNTYEIPGGHIESGESHLSAASRELYEETGITNCKLTFISIYTVTKGDITDGGYLYMADVEDLGELPDFEMAEIKLFNSLPDSLTYPAIQTELYDHIQNYISSLSAADELWDVYNSERILTGRLHKRGVPLAQDEYHLIVMVFIIQSDGRYFITKRAPTKGYANLWEFTGGAAMAGDDSLTAAIREAKEETGIILSPENGKIIYTSQHDQYFCDIWQFYQDVDLSQVILLPGETVDARFATHEEITLMIKNHEFIPYREVVELFVK